MRFVYNNDKNFCSTHVAVVYVSVYITRSSFLLNCFLRKGGGK